MTFVLPPPDGSELYPRPLVDAPAFTTPVENRHGGGYKVNFNTLAASSASDTDSSIERIIARDVEPNEWSCSDGSLSLGIGNGDIEAAEGESETEEELLVSVVDACTIKPATPLPNAEALLEQRERTIREQAAEIAALKAQLQGVSYMGPSDSEGRTMRAAQRMPEHSVEVAKRGSKRAASNETDLPSSLEIHSAVDLNGDGFSLGPPGVSRHRGDMLECRAIDSKCVLASSLPAPMQLPEPTQLCDLIVDLRESQGLRTNQAADEKAEALRQVLFNYASN